MSLTIFILGGVVALRIEDGGTVRVMKATPDKISKYLAAIYSDIQDNPFESARARSAGWVTLNTPEQIASGWPPDSFAA